LVLLIFQIENHQQIYNLYSSRKQTEFYLCKSINEY